MRKLSKLIERMRKSHEENLYDECVKSAQMVMNHDRGSHFFVQKGRSYMCICNSKAKNTKEAIQVCSQLLDNNPNDSEALYYRAQAYINEELLEQGRSLLFWILF